MHTLSRRQLIAGKGIVDMTSQQDDGSSDIERQLDPNDRLPIIFEELGRVITETASDQDLYYLRLGLEDDSGRHRVLVGHMYNPDTNMLVGMSLGVCIYLPAGYPDQHPSFTQEQLAEGLSIICEYILNSLREVDCLDLISLFEDDVYQGKIMVEWSFPGLSPTTNPLAATVGIGIGIPAHEYQA